MSEKTYARVESGEVIELFETGGDITEMFDASLVWVDCSGVEGCAPGWTYSNSQFQPPAPVSATTLWLAYQGQAKAALDASDVTILRCYENAVTVPASWATYRKALRAIVSAASGDPTQVLPVRPAYPSGT
jgi:hypothetical protein